MGESLTSTARAGTEDTKSDAVEKFPFDDFEFDLPTAMVPLLHLKSPRRLKALSISIPASASGNYTFSQSEQTTDLFLTAGASEATVDLTAVSTLANVGRSLRVFKDDSDAGEVKLDAGASGLFYWPGGGSARYIYVGLQYQSVEIELISAGSFRVVGGVVQPMAGEPDIGGGTHIIADARLTVTPLVSTDINTAGVWSSAVTMTGVPVGARSGYCHAYVAKGSAAPIMSIAPASGITLSDTSTGNNWRKYLSVRSPSSGATAGWGGTMICVFLDSNRQFKWTTTDSSSTVLIGSPVSYSLGPV